MATVKKRKLEGRASGSSTPPAVVEKALEKAVEDGPWQTKSETRFTRVLPSRNSKRRSVDEVDAKQAQGNDIDGDDGGSGSEPSGRRAVKQHSSFKPTKTKLQRKAGGRLVLATSEAERLLVLGSYGVRVRAGEATIAGAILSPSDDVQWVHAPHCHAVPVLRTAEDTVLELQPHPAARGLRQLARLNPAFGRLWNETLPQDTDSGRAGKYPASFQIIYTSEDAPKRAVMQELVAPGAWNKKLSGLAAARRKATPVIFLCGPKSSGKSTFGRLLANRFITDRGGARNRPWSSVMVLDLDPGQPEYSPPGVVSLSRISTPNLSPSFCHPTLTPTQGQIRAHAIASVTPALDPSHFIECALDLFAHYQRGPDAKSPLIINTPGWVQGTGLDILSELITALRPTEVLYMSQDGPSETVSTLQSAAAATNPPIPFTPLPSQPTDTAPPRTSLHLRTMQTMSYFHLSQTLAQTATAAATQTWDPAPLTALPPYRVRYTTGFRGILCYDHQPAASLLAEAINGTILALVKVESTRAFRDLLLPPNSSPPAFQPLTTETSPTTQSKTKTKTKTNNKTSNKQPEPPIPLIPNPQGRTLDPRHSRLLGLVLVRGVDAARHELQLLTPLSRDTVSALDGDELVLVAGRFDTPSWAYAEDLCRRRGGGAGEEGVEDGEEGEAEVPWVEMLHGSQKRAVGSKVWRVRRDLGRS
ncbi:hypothetical protein BT67DRAFT_458017 [Trichocladium antarcticum]|uniref:Polynucleotide 5'-hydroxyl-kinase GRC3 n=1 Tax=Trichocladium antarcticum TaxID=1450529 RepID=A0AAN6ZA23_9PEZI|nr:hypothetical protein BT67DRAFT_458017 [Trichocladium antarcticum]